MLGGQPLTGFGSVQQPGRLGLSADPRGKSGPLCRKALITTRPWCSFND